jgi:hypothetical protein
MSDVNDETAARLASDALAVHLADSSQTTGGDLSRLDDLCMSIRADLQAGDTPDSDELEEARACAESVIERLDDTAALFNINRWYAGTPWSELSDDERAAVDESTR